MIGQAMIRLGLLLVLLLFVGCTSSLPLRVTQFGFDVTVHMKPDSSVSGELLMVNDSLLVLAMPEIRSVRANDVVSVSTPSLEGESSWMIMSLMVQALPTGVLFAFAEEEGGKGQIEDQRRALFAGVTGVLVTLTTWVSLGSDDLSDHRPPWTPESLSRLRGYARYPQGLPETRLMQLLERGR